MLKPFWWTRRCEMISDGESRGVFWSLVSWCGRRANVVVCQGLCGEGPDKRGGGVGGTSGGVASGGVVWRAWVWFRAALG